MNITFYLTTSNFLKSTFFSNDRSFLKPRKWAILGRKLISGKIELKESSDAINVLELFGEVSRKERKNETDTFPNLRPGNY